ncbi:hypothetical protein C1X64_09410 [Pseudomonas sp. GW456-E7]|nr:hypothetical protein C1X64_09410 [Pseudomonas sp. GW456-E7]
MLAMSVNDNACLLDKRVDFRFIASKLAPTQKNVSTSVSDRVGNPVIIRASVPRLLSSSRYERIHEH